MTIRKKINKRLTGEYKFVNSANSLSDISNTVIEDSSTYLPVKGNITLGRMPVKTTFIIPEELGESSGIVPVNISVLDKNGRLVQEKIVTVEHINEKRIALIPNRRPEISVATDNLKRIVSIQQRDSSANYISLYCSESGNPEHPSSWKIISEFRLTKNQSVSIEYMCSVENNVTFRAIAFNKKLRLHGAFKDCISMGYCLPSDNRKSSIKRKTNYLHATINTRPQIKNTKEQSRPGVSLIFAGATYTKNIAVIKKRNVTAKEREFTDISRVAVKSINSFYDIGQLDENTIYEYEIECFSRDSSDSEICRKIIKYVKPKDYIRSSANLVRSVIASGEIKCEFSLSAKFSFDSGFGIMTLIKSMGIASFFGNDIESIKEKISNIIVFNCKRIEISKNGYAVKDLGITQPGYYASSFKLNEKCGTVIYEFTPYVITPTAAIDEISKRTSDGNIPASLQGAADLKETPASDSGANKFFNEYSINEGTLSYGNILKNNHTKNPMLGENTGVVSAVIVPVPPMSGGLESLIENANFTVRPNKSCLITWRFSGKNISHFVIIKNINNISFVIGAHHHVPNQGRNFRFLDTSGKTDAGSLSYSIIAKNLDGTSTSKNTQTSVIQY